MAWEGQLFSNATKLGFAAAHDSPALNIEEAQFSLSNEMNNQAPWIAGSSTAAAPSFANIISREKSTGSKDVSKTNEIGKKGKKPIRVLMSTAGGRRY